MNNKKLSNNFWLSELLDSDTAERTGGKMLKQQSNPDASVIANLKYHAKTTIQPARDYLGVGIKINSGYRSPLLNTAVKGSKTSEHCFGMATDQVLSNGYVDECSLSLNNIERLVFEITGKHVNSYSSNFYLWAFYCLELDKLDINQVIHEYGSDGAPKWIHVSSSINNNKRQILIKRSGQGYAELSLKDALMLGC